MKVVRKMFILFLVLAMVLSNGVTAFAEETAYTIIVNNDPSATNVSIEGRMFNAYKIFDVTYTVETKEDGERNSYAYTIDSETSAWFDQVLAYMEASTDEQGIYRAKGITLTPAAAKETVYSVAIDSESDARALADYLGRYLNSADQEQKPEADNSAQGVKISEEKETATIEVKESGYYLVTGEGTADGGTAVVAAAALYTTNPTAEIDLKAGAPAIEKKIVEGGETVDANNAAIGDTVTYKITSEVPDMTGYSKYFFIVNDTLSGGLTFNNDVAVIIGDKELVSGTDYTVTAGDYDRLNGTSIKIVFMDFIKYSKGDAITITYSATLNESAVIGTAGNPNKVKLTYSTNPNVESEGKSEEEPDEPGTNDPTGETPEDTVYTYVTGIELIKVDEEGNHLTGAEFQITGEKTNIVLVSSDVYEKDENGIYWKLKDGSYTTTDPAAEGIDESKYADTDTRYTKATEIKQEKTKENAEAIGTVGEDGVLRFEGLSAGTYTINEIIAPSGYNLLTSSVTVVIDWTGPSDMTAAEPKCGWFVGDGSDESAEATEDGMITLSVLNKKGHELPSTGGIGTTVFYVVGSVLMAGALGLIVVRKKKS